MANKSTLRPITDLRDTNGISKQCHESNEPIFITKNGYEDLVIMSSDTFNGLKQNAPDDGHTLQKTRLANGDSLVRVGCISNYISVAEVSKNTSEIIRIIKESKSKDLDVLVFPELSLTGYTCGDLFYFNSLIDNTLKGLDDVVNSTIGYDTLFFVGAPLVYKDKLYNCAIAIFNGNILGVVPKSNLPNYNEFYEKRQFVPFSGENKEILINGIFYPFGTKLIFVNSKESKLKISCELCEDLWAVNTPSTNHVLAGANVIVNLSASNELFGKDEIRRTLVKAASSRLNCAYLYSSAGNGESSQDLVYSGHNIIAENGFIIKESKLFSNELIVTDIDLDIISSSRQKSSSFSNTELVETYKYIYYDNPISHKDILRDISPTPFLPNNKEDHGRYGKEIINLQKKALEKRLTYLRAKDVVIGISGGLDSTLALIVAYEAFKELNLDTSGIHTLIMPGFGTSKRTHNNAIELTKLFNTNTKIIDISEACKLHLAALGHSLDVKDVVYENAQARERTQILFDYANSVNGIVIGTGDLSELALGWATFNGDQMSNYAINSSVPKTLVRFLVNEYAKNNKPLYDLLIDILNTPISPELLPTENGNISQETEDIIGPYELHDFFLYYLLKYNFTTQKIFMYAKKAFKNKYDELTIKHWLNKFIERFFRQQFKRSTLPDGPKVTEVSLSPRGDLRMPTDASYNDYLI